MSAPRPLLPVADSTLPEAAWRREVAAAIARLVPATGEATVAADTTETVVRDRRAGPGSVVVAAALAPEAARTASDTLVWIKARGRGRFTLGHQSRPQARRFAYAILGA